MPSTKVIIDQINLIKTIDEIAGALGDIATTRLKQTRKSIEHNINFFQEISEVYAVVKNQAGSLLNKEALKRTTNGKTALLLITANNRLYGGLDSELVKFFVVNTKDISADRYLIGLAGKGLLISLKYEAAIKNVVFKENSPTFAELKALASEVFNYQKILVFHTKFVSVLNQIPTISDISHVDIKDSKRPSGLYLLEPEISKMIQFFENQISILLFQAIFAEVDLARLAARMNSMNQAEDNVRKVIEIEKKELLKSRKLKLNFETISTYVSLKIMQGRS